MLTLPRQKIQEMKLKWFQISLLHRILATHIVSKEIGITQKHKVFYAIFVTFKETLERDSLQHCMWGCEHMKSFWNELERLICQNCENVHDFKFDEFQKHSFFLFFLVPTLIVKVTIFLT